MVSICRKEPQTFASTFNSEVVVSVYWCSLLTRPYLSTGGFQAVQDNRQATGVAELEGNSGDNDSRMMMRNLTLLTVAVATLSLLCADRASGAGRFPHLLSAWLLVKYKP